MPGIKDWTAKASGNLQAAKKLITGDDNTLDFAAYATQQSAEKALKAFLVFKAQPIPKTHDLEKLLLTCTKFDASFQALRPDIRKLLPYATYTRYPDDYFEIDRDEVIQAIEHAEKILLFIKTKTNTEKVKPGQSTVF